MNTLSRSVEETFDAARSFIEKVLKERGEIGGALVAGFHGDLGSGKTTFVKGVAATLGVDEHITSPTFVILKKYLIPDARYKILVHVDAYRLESGQDLLPLGWEEIIEDKGNLVLVEWPEIVADVMPGDTIRINFEFVDENTRRIGIMNRNKNHNL